MHSPLTLPSSSVVALVFAGTLITPLAAQQQVDGQGYINLRAPTTPWVPPTDAAVTPRFIWQPTHNAVRIGPAELSAQIVGGSAANSFAFGGGNVGMDAFLFNGASAPDGSFVFGSGVSALAVAGSFTQIVLGNSAYATRSGIAIGLNANAQENSYSLGALSHASDNSAAFGNMSRAFTKSTSFGFNSAATKFSVALGNEAMAGGVLTSRGVALGYSTFSTGNAAVALGYDSTAVADYSVAVGPNSITNAIGQIRLGRAAVVPKKRGLAQTPSVSNAAQEDPVLVVGNGVNAAGSPPANEKAPLIIYRDGEACFSKVVRVPPAGDIDMLLFVSGIDPRN